MIFLGGQYRDIYYEQRRRGAVFITLGCNKPFPNCFCNATKNGPFLEFGFDLQLTDLDKKGVFFVESGKANGKKIIHEWPQFFSPSNDEHRRSQYQAALGARSLFKRQVHVDLACQQLKKGNTADEILTDLSQRCQDCGGCAYICPTCTCFTITDQQRDAESGERIRSWDACTFAGFSRMAGNHNPIDMKKQRMRKRFFHKLKHDVQKHGRPSCVGCGRCVDMCFGGVDIVRFINLLTEAGEI
jgi:ferredoxin